MSAICIIPWCYAGTILFLLLDYGMGVRVMVLNDVIVEENTVFVTGQEVMNVVIAGSMAYLAWARGLKELVGR